MEIITATIAGDLRELPPWSDPLPPNLDEEEFDILAFELWQRASRQDAAAEQDCPDEEIVVGSHASCL